MSVRQGFVLACVCLAAAGGWSRGAAQRPPPSRGSFQDVGPRFSPDGTRIAFFRRWPDSRTAVMVADARLRSVRQLLPPEELSPDRRFATTLDQHLTPQALAWSPTGDALAVPRQAWHHAGRGERLPVTTLWTVRLSDGALEPLAILPSDHDDDLVYYHAPCWAARGHRVSWIGGGIEGQTALFVRELAATPPDGTSPRRDRAEDVGWPAWSPDGSRLAFRLGIQRRLTDDHYEAVRVLAPGRREALTPVMLRQPPGAGVRRIAGLAWSPDGRRLALTVDEDALRPGGESVWLVEARPGAVARRLTRSGDGDVLAPVFLDSASVGALRRRGPAYEAVAVPVERGPMRRIAQVPAADLDWAPDRRSIVCVDPSATGQAALRRIPIR